MAAVVKKRNGFIRGAVGEERRGEDRQIVNTRDRERRRKEELNYFSKTKIFHAWREGG